ncbi:MAG: DinB family protein [Coriobacteriia bacterium]|nr:DinB family protein [Coriobacteriia bacterium]
MENNEILRATLSRMLERSEAHTDFDAAVSGIAPEARGVRPAGLPHSAWELLEHIRRAQRDILDFCLEAPYTERAWPAEYWPETAEPPSPEAWDESVAIVQRDRAEFQQLVADASIELTAIVPHGTKQTYLREVLLAADHNAYHVGQLMVVRRLV